MHPGKFFPSELNANGHSTDYGGYSTFPDYSNLRFGTITREMEKVDISVWPRIERMPPQPDVIHDRWRYTQLRILQRVVVIATKRAPVHIEGHGNWQSVIARGNHARTREDQREIFAGF